MHTYRAFAKQRWAGRTLLDVLANEFGGFPEIYCRHAIASGSVRLNGDVVEPDTELRLSDCLTHEVRIGTARGGPLAPVTPQLGHRWSEWRSQFQRSCRL